ncbi:hypothetical protein OSTOST_07921 [Ostertagia ostertagi]
MEELGTVHKDLFFTSLSGQHIAICTSEDLCTHQEERLKNGELVKRVHKSVILSSMVVIFGFFLTMVVFFIGTALNADATMLKRAASSFITIATAVNFFVYYTTSSQYRQIFDELLGIGRLKGTVWCAGSEVASMSPTRRVHFLHLKTIKDSTNRS